MKNRFVLISACICLTVLFAGCPKKDDRPSPQLQTVIARWQGGQMTLGECLHFFRELHTPDEVDMNNPIEGFRQFINEWVAEKILWERARDAGFDRDPKYLDRIRPRKNQWLMKLLVRQNVDERIVLKRRDLKRYYEEHRDDFMTPATYSYYRIFISNDKYGPERAEQRARECWGLLDKGANFNDLVSEYSDTPLEKRYVEYGPFRAGENPADIEEVIMQTPVGRHSPVIKLPNGFMILYPTKKEEAVLKPFESVRSVIERELFDQKRKAALEAYLEELSTRYKLHPRRELFEKTGVEPDETLLTIEPGGGYYTWGDFLSYTGGKKPDNQAELDQSFEEFARRMLLIHHAIQTKFEETPYFRDRFRPIEIRVLSDYFMELTVDSSVEPTEEDVRKFYEENGGLFERPARMEVWHLARKIKVPLDASEKDRINEEIKVRNQLLKIRELIADSGHSFITWANRFTEYEDGGYLGFVPLLAMPPEWVRHVAVLEEGEISQPIKVRDTFEMVLRGKYEKPGILKFDAAREKAYELTRDDMIAKARVAEIDRLLTEKNVVFDLRPVGDLLLRLVERAKHPPSYWLDPYQ